MFQLKNTLFDLLAITVIFTSCNGQTSKNQPIDQSDSITKTEVANAPLKDTLKFTSGIRAIFQDSKGNYWFGSYHEGVARFDGTTFTYFTTNEELIDNQIHAIQEDNNGIIWFNTQKGVCSYDGQQIVSRANENDITMKATWMKSDNDLWFEAGNNEGVFRFDGQKMNYLEFPPHKVFNPNNNLFAATCLSKGKNNRIWIGTYAGIFGYNGKDFQIINDETLGYDRKIEELHIRSILEDSKGRLWIGNNGNGVLLMENDTIINFSEKHNLIHPNSKRNGDPSPPGTLEHIFTIVEDKNGAIWFGDRDAGIWKYDGENVVNYTKKDELNNDFAMSIYQDKNDQLWFGMANGSVYVFNGKSFERKF